MDDATSSVNEHNNLPNLITVVHRLKLVLVARKQPCVPKSRFTSMLLTSQKIKLYNNLVGIRYILGSTTPVYMGQRHDHNFITRMSAW